MTAILRVCFCRWCHSRRVVALEPFCGVWCDQCDQPLTEHTGGMGAMVLRALRKAA